MSQASRIVLLCLLVLATGCSASTSGSDAAPVAQPAPITPLPPATTAPPAAKAPITAEAAPTTTTSTTTTTVPPTTTTTTTTLPPVFSYSVAPVTAETVHATWREECPLPFAQLSLLTLTYWDLEGNVRQGPMVINTAVVSDVVTAFEGLFDIGFPIERVELVDDYGGDDKAAMRANVTSGFNCRFVDGTDRWSNHAFGLAIDINPLLNPWAREGNVLPVEGGQYTDRELDLPGMINLGDEAVTIFEEVGWSWGGVWQSADYMHFSRPGN